MPTYQPDDVNEILRRAQELQARTQGTGGAGGLSPDDLATLGREIGIDPKFVAEALRQRARGADVSAPPGGGVFGGPGRVEAERVLPGPLTDDLWTELVDEMRSLSGHPGEQTVIGTAREWRHTVGMGSGSHRAFLTAAPAREGGTRVRVERATLNAAVPTFLIPLQIVFGLGLFASMGYGLPGLGASVLAFVLVFLVARFAYGRHTRRAWASLTALLDRAELAALRLAPSEAQAAPAGRIALPGADAPETGGFDTPDRLRTSG